jgi:hypothetical protein
LAFVFTGVKTRTTKGTVTEINWAGVVLKWDNRGD